MRITFKKMKVPSFSAKMHQISVNGEQVGCIQMNGAAKWFWYIRKDGNLHPHNSCGAAVKELDTAKNEIKQYIRENWIEQ